MPVLIGPLPAPNGDRAPWQLAFPAFPSPQNHAAQAPLPHPPWSSPASPALYWPFSLINATYTVLPNIKNTEPNSKMGNHNASDQIPGRSGAGGRGIGGAGGRGAAPASLAASLRGPLAAVSGMPLRSHPEQPIRPAGPVPPAAAPGRLQPAHVSTAVAAWQDQLVAGVAFRAQNTPQQSNTDFLYEQSRLACVLQPKMGAIYSQPTIDNAPDFFPGAPAQHRRLDSTGLDTYRCYDKPPGQFDDTVRYVRAGRGRRAVLNQLEFFRQAIRLVPLTVRVSLAQGMTWGL